MGVDRLHDPRHRSRLELSRGVGRPLGATRASLTVVGTGINGAAQTTPEAREAIEQADEVLYLVAEPATARFVERLNRRARSLHGLCNANRPRRETYDAIVDEILAPVRAGARVCAALSGHPGVFVDPSHRAVALARSEGLPARMQPAVSALDCLVADLGIDPADPGLVSYEATAFLLHRRQPDPTTTLVLWQPDVVGERFAGPDGHGSRLPVLVDYLSRTYAARHETIVYKASPYAIARPIVRRVPLGELTQDVVPRASTLVIPALADPVVDGEMIERLRLASKPQSG